MSIFAGRQRLNRQPGANTLLCSNNSDDAVVRLLAIMSELLRLTASPAAISGGAGDDGGVNDGSGC